MGEFRAYLAGLSPDSLYRNAIANAPVELSGEAAQSFIATL